MRCMLPSPLVDAGLRLAAGLAGGLAGAPSLIIVTYHRVLPEPDPLLPSEPDTRPFRIQVSFLARHLRVFALREALQRLRDGTLPRRAVCITFDDGYANNLHCALPVLQSLGLPATVFVATGYLNGGCMWNDGVIETFRRTRERVLDLTGLGLGRYELTNAANRRAGIADVLGQLKYRPLAERTATVAAMARLADVQLPHDLMLTSAELRSLHDQGVEIGGHTVNHPILARVSPDEARREIGDGAAQLAAITGTRPQVFAYPNGRPGTDFGPEHGQMVKDAGFTHALTTEWGLGRQQTDPYRVPRVTLWSRTVPRLTANLMSLYAKAR